MHTIQKHCSTCFMGVGVAPEAREWNIEYFSIWLKCNTGKNVFWGSFGELMKSKGIIKYSLQ